MATKTIISDSYAPFGTIVTGPPTVAEPPRRELVFLNKKQLLKRLRWTEADFEVAISLGEPFRFPTPGKTIPKNDWGYDLVWPDTVLDAWLDRCREYVAVMQRLVGGKG